MEEKFCLKWKDFQENTTKTFSNLRQEKDFFDVTLVSDDQKQIMAHKVVLSSTSEYFKNILKTNKHSHPMLCLTGITSGDLENVLDYIYQGEVEIFQGDIDNFFGIAQRFKIDGLLSSDRESDTKQEDHLSSLTSETATNKHETIEKSTRDIYYGESGALSSYNISLFNDDSSLDEIEQKITQNIGRNENGDFVCNICGKVGVKRYLKNLKLHIETHLDGIAFSCDVCGKQCKSRVSLNTHKRIYHK